MKTRPTFILGLGAQKCGTTWLSDYLDADPAVGRGFVRQKEFHIWDHLDVPALWPDARRFRTCRSLEDFGLTAMERWPRLYFDYFAQVLRKAPIAADITPAYSCLSEGRLRMIAAEFDRRGITVKTVFLMRDPVARCVSAFQMDRARRLASGSAEGIADPDADRAFSLFIHDVGCRLRTDYPATLDAMDRALDPGKCHIAFYETLFQPDSIDRLSRFLGVSYAAYRAEKIANPALRKETLSLAALRRCAELYRDVYAGVASRFPQVRGFWKGFDHLST